jgi:hypothetical protein
VKAMSYLRNQVLYNMIIALVADVPLRERLAGIATYMGQRILGSFEDSDEPVLKRKMAEIYERLTKVKAGPDDDGDIDATVKRLSDEEAKSIAHDIVGLAFNFPWDRS